MGLSVYSTLGAGAATFVVGYVISRKIQRSCYPPGPYPLPVIGHFREMGKAKPWMFLRKIHEKYGDVVTIFLATTPCVILNSLEAVREGYLGKANDFAYRPVLYSAQLFTKGGKDIAVGQFGPIWKKQRKIAHAAMRKFASGAFLAQLINNSFQMSAVELDKFAASGEKFNPKHIIDMTIYNIIFSMVFGKTIAHDDKALTDFIKLTDDAQETIGNGFIADFLPIFKYIPLQRGSMKLFLDSIDALFKLVDGIYEDHKKNFDETNVKDIVDHILQSVNELEKEEGKAVTDGLTAEHYQMIILDIFSAGTDTSRFTLLWVVLYMAAYPECQKKMQEEVDEAVGTDQISIADHGRLPYTEAFLHEVMRIRPLSALGVPHETGCDTSVGGHPIPKGTMVMANTWSIHMDKEAWGDPEVFRPERFLKEDGTMGPRISSWLPFSTGRRVCVGEAVAKAELHLTLATFVQRYNFSAPPGVKLELEPKIMSPLMVPEDYDVVITKRV